MQTEDETHSAHETGDACDGGKIQVAGSTQVTEGYVPEGEIMDVEDVGFAHNEFFIKITV